MTRVIVPLGATGEAFLHIPDGWTAWTFRGITFRRADEGIEQRAGQRWHSVQIQVMEAA